jgi:hypothetical protein
VLSKPDASDRYSAVKEKTGKRIFKEKELL